MFGLTAQGQILALTGAILRSESETVLRELHDLAQHGKDLGRLLSDLLNYFRNLLIYQVSRGDMKILEVSETEAASLAEQSAQADTPTLTRIMEVLTDAEGRLRHVASKKIFLEVTLLKAIEARSAVSLDAVLKQLQQLRGDTGAGSLPAMAPAPAAVTTPRTTASSASAPAPANLSTPAASTGGDADLDSLWRNVLEAVGRASAFTRSYLVEAFPVSLAKNVLDRKSVV